MMTHTKTIEPSSLKVFINQFIKTPSWPKQKVSQQEQKNNLKN